jgi:hypothetical protein
MTSSFKNNAVTGHADTPNKLGKIIHRFNLKAAAAVSAVFDHSFADRESDALLIEPLTDRFMKIKSYLKPYFGVGIDDVVRDSKEPRPYVLIHLIPLTARAVQLAEIARRHRLEKNLPQIPHPLTVFFFFELPLQQEQPDGRGGPVPFHGQLEIRPDIAAPAVAEGRDAP